MLLSRTRARPETIALAERLGMETTRTGSAGVKGARVATGEADAYVHLGTAGYLWDVAAVDAIVQRLLSSRTRADLVTAARALDRVLRAGWYLVPHFYAPSHRVAWRARLAHPDTLPLYYAAETWLLKTWWEKR